MKEGADGGSYSSFTITLGNRTFANNTATTTNAITTATGVQTEIGYTGYQADAVDLQSIALVARNQNQKLTDPLTLVLTDSAGEVVAVSSSSSQESVVNHDIFDSSAYWTRYLCTFSFESASDSLLSIGETYTATFYSVYSEETRTVSKQSLFASKISAAPDSSGVQFGTSMYQPGGMVLKAVGVVPEPSAATLSLLALAGLVARRRRK